VRPSPHQDKGGPARKIVGFGAVGGQGGAPVLVAGGVANPRVLGARVWGQCTPCREGSGWLEKVLRRIETGAGRDDDLDLLLDVCDNIAPGLTWPPQQTTICPLGPSIPSSIVSAVRMFRDEFLVHVKEGGCPHG